MVTDLAPGQASYFATGRDTHCVITHGSAEINGPNWRYRYF